MPQPSLDGSGMKDISDGLHTINTAQCLQLSGQLKPSPPPDSDLSDTDLASAPSSHHAGPVSPCHRLTGGARVSLGPLSINASGSSQPVDLSYIYVGQNLRN